MGIPKDFPLSPYEIIDPSKRWIPDKEDLFSNRNNPQGLVPPLVPQIRDEVKVWRDGKYPGLSRTTKALLTWWFEEEHISEEGTQFQYYFSQRESVESVIYLYEVKGCRNPEDLFTFDRFSSLSSSMFYESWLRLVCKQATGSGKTKVLSLLLAWCYFHKKYEEDSDLSTNFLLITPNIIVLDRILSDFEGLKIFNEDPILPEEGYMGQSWKSDFNITLHIQDEIKPINPEGNIFLTNIHRVYDKSKDTEPSSSDEDLTDYFLGEKAVVETTDDKYNLSELVREIQDIVILNDEAHHIHSEDLAWFQSIQDIHNNLLQREGRLALQLDVTATPKKPEGNIFVQTISDYPLVEAIRQGVVKTPVLPDKISREKLKEKASLIFAEKYSDYIRLGYIEWKKAYKNHIKVGKKAVMFIMVDDTKNCDGVKDFLELHYPDIKGEVFVIHTNKNGELKKLEPKELQKLRDVANTIDSPNNKFKVIVSVMMLKEGWDVKNVTTVVGLRSFSSKSNILPEQTLGRGLRRMYFGRDDIQEKVSVIGTKNFLDFVESIKEEGVTLETGAMGEKAEALGPILIEIEQDNPNKNKLDLIIPLLQARIKHVFKDLKFINIEKLSFEVIKLENFTEEEMRNIHFRDMTTEELSHITQIGNEFEGDAVEAIKHYSTKIFDQLKLVGGKNVLFGKVKLFVETMLFGNIVDLMDKQVVYNLYTSEAKQQIITTFKKAINELTLTTDGNTAVLSEIKVNSQKPFFVKEKAYYRPHKCAFNKIVGDSGFENLFSAFLDNASDVDAYVYCYRQLGFGIEYINADGNPATYFPDFVVKLNDGSYCVVETKGDTYVNENTPLKRQRLIQWCEDCSKEREEYWGSFYILYSQWEAIKTLPNTLNKLISSTNK